MNPGEPCSEPYILEGRRTMRFFDLFTIFFAQLLNFLFGLLVTSLGT